jgi:hypothetical protein
MAGRIAAYQRVILLEAAAGQILFVGGLLLEVPAWVD